MQDNLRFEEFVDQVIKNICKVFPDSVIEDDFKVIQIKQLNRQYNGLVLRNGKDRQGSHVVNLELLYNNYMRGISIEEIVELAVKWFKQDDLKFEPEKFLDFNKFKKDLFVKVTNKEKNKELLKKVPHTIIKDLVLTYHVRVEAYDRKVCSHIISNQDMEYIGISKTDIHSAAMENGLDIFGYQFERLTEYTGRIFAEQMKGEGIPEDVVKEILKELLLKEQKDNASPYILTNLLNINGASTLFYPGIMERIAKELNSSYYIFPASVHEMVIVADATDMTIEYMQHMVKHINQDEISPAEWLSDNVYHYDMKTKTFEFATEYIERKQVFEFPTEMDH